eukprot:1931233-Alexandrium_andersonii.AAC.1
MATGRAVVAHGGTRFPLVWLVTKRWRRATRGGDPRAVGVRPLGYVSPPRDTDLVSGVDMAGGTRNPKYWGRGPGPRRDGGPASPGPSRWP